MPRADRAGGETVNHGRLPPQRPEPCERWVARRPGDVCSATTGAERRPQDIRGMSALRRPKRSEDLGPMGACHATTEAMRKMGRVRSGGPHATSRPSRRRDLDPWAPAPQRPEPCGRWGARHPGDVCSAPTEAERRP